VAPVNIGAAMDSFRKLAIVSTVATYLLVAVGGLVRATKSGLGCGNDWPDCNGEFLPVLHSRPVLIEYSHRLAALVVVVLVGVLAVRAWRERRKAPKLAAASGIAFGLVLFQALLGMIVVKLDLEALSVALHLTTAMAFAAVLIYIVAVSSEATNRLDNQTDPALGRWAVAAAGSVLLLLMVGSYVTGVDAGYVFPDWPLMDGRLVPDFGSVRPELAERYAIHFTHRALAALVGILVGVVALKFIRRKNDFPQAARLAHVALGLFAVEVVIGAFNVWTALNEVVVFLHLVFGSVIWGTLIGMVVLTAPWVRAAAGGRALAGTKPALEGSG
jgi:heme a synthase